MQNICRWYKFTPVWLSFVAVILAGSAIASRAETIQSLGPQEPPFVPEQPIAIVNGDLIDATGTPPKLGYTVIIEGERITTVGSHDEVKIPDGALVIDAEGMTIMPGIINSNQHVQLHPLFKASAADLPLDVLIARWDENFSRMPGKSYHYLMQGITSMRQTSGPSSKLLPLKQKIDSGELAGPRLFLGGALFISQQHFESYIRENDTPEESIEWLRNEFAYNVIEDIEKDTDAFLGPQYNYWKLYMSDEEYDGKNDFSDSDLRYIIDKAHKHGKRIDVHTGGSNAGLARMTEFNIDTLEHPFYGSFEVADETINAYVKNGVIIASLLRVFVSVAERSQDPHRFNESLYIMSMEPEDYRLLLRYRDKILANRKNPSKPGQALYENYAATLEGEGAANAVSDFSDLSYIQVQERREVSIRNMRKFIRAGARFSLGTDTPTFLNFLQEDPNALEYANMIEYGMTPMDAIIAATRNGAEMLGMEQELGTIEEGKLADVIVVAGNPLADIAALKRVYAVIKGGVRYK